jgi:hypothetical protein
MLRPVSTCAAFRDLAEAGNVKPPNDEAIKKANRLEQTLSRLEEPLTETLPAQLRQPRLREHNNTPLFPGIVSGRIIVGLN